MSRLFRKKFALGLCLAFVVCVFFGGCKGQENKYQAPPPPKVTVGYPTQRTVTVYAEFTGNTSALESVDIRARVAGYLKSINFLPSARVKKGDLLFVIDPRPFQAKVNQAKADLATSEAELQLADATLTRKARAFKAKAVSEVEVIQARAEKAKALASIEASKAALETAMIDLGYTTITAPIDGRISRSLVDVGNLVGAQETTKLTNIVQDDPIYAYFNVSEQDVLHYQRLSREGKLQTKGRGNALIYLATSEDEGFPHEGEVDYVDNRVDPATGTIQVRAKFPNSKKILVPGIFVRLRLPVEQRKDSLLVPDSALGADQQGRYLLIVDDKDVVQYRKVEIGPLEPGGLRLIRKGIKAKDKVIVNGLLRVRPGIKVQVEMASDKSEPSQKTQENPKAEKEKSPDQKPEKTSEKKEDKSPEKSQSEKTTN